jgi:hypothetical protein
LQALINAPLLDEAPPSFVDLAPAQPRMTRQTSKKLEHAYAFSHDDADLVVDDRWVYRV